MTRRRKPNVKLKGKSALITQPKGLGEKAPSALMRTDRGKRGKTALARERHVEGSPVDPCKG